MATSTDKSWNLKQACSWTCWVLGNTDMPKRNALRSASKKFGVSMAAIERGVIEIVGPEWLANRGKSMIQKYSPVRNGYSRAQILVKQSSRTWKRMFS